MAFFLFPLLVLVGLVFMLYYAWTFTVLWAWFLVPLGAPAITLAHAYGIMLITGLFKDIKLEKGQKTAEEWGSAMMAWLQKPIFALAIGGIVKFFFLS